MQAIINKLNEVFAPLDAEVLVKSQEWAKGRATALRTFKKSEEYDTLCRAGDSWKLYNKMFAICGGKTWYAVFNSSDASIADFMVKNCAAIVAKRNALITRKLVKAGVTEVVSEEFTHSLAGFNGMFVVNTDAGRKVVTINTVRAGGYNIQCLHLRVLVKVK